MTSLPARETESGQGGELIDAGVEAASSTEATAAGNPPAAGDLSPSVAPPAGKAGAAGNEPVKVAAPAPESPPASIAVVDRRLLDEIFGDVLPETTADERDADARGGFSEQWYRDNRPPHHGDRA